LSLALSGPFTEEGLAAGDVHGPSRRGLKLLAETLPRFSVFLVLPHTELPLCTYGPTLREEPVYFITGVLGGLLAAGLSATENRLIPKNYFTLNRISEIISISADGNDAEDEVGLAADGGCLVHARSARCWAPFDARYSLCTEVHRFSQQHQEIALILQTNLSLPSIRMWAARWESLLLDMEKVTWKIFRAQK